MARLFQARLANDLPPWPDYNICPTQPVLTVRHEGDGRFMGPMRWGFIPPWYKDPKDGPLIINARAESVADKPAFREAARKRRCLVPVSGFYEWKREGGRSWPWYVTRADGAPLVLAGIWQPWKPADGDESLLTFAIVTAEAGPPVDRIHNRVPVVIEQPDWPLWLGEAGLGAARLMHAPPPDVLTMWPVSPKVNSRKAHGPELIEPWPEAPGAPGAPEAGGEAEAR